jgi:asparagine synthetase B (glutamine-hydrolysing)
MIVAQPYRLSPLEVASGLVFGHERESRGREHPSDPREAPVAALERAILPALLHSPCLVSFSGGRDSSAVLAVAAQLARREGLPLPIPATNRFSEVTASDESTWQERVVAHVGVQDWIKLDFADELDSVGPVARRVLRRHGLLWPFNTHFHLPLLEAARGGSLLTGVGGDEVLGDSRWERARSVLMGEVPPVPRDVLRVGFAVSPRRVRSRVLRRRVLAAFPWLRENARRAVTAAWAAEAAGEPMRWQARFRWWRGLRYIRVGMSSLALLAADEDVRIVHPLADAGFSAALGRLPPELRFPDRDGAMQLLFADVLPKEVLVRTTKASFDGAFFNRYSRGLIESWEGEAVNDELVDTAMLRTLWTSLEPDARSFTLLQAVWLARAGGRALSPVLSRIPSRAGTRLPERTSPNRGAGAAPRQGELPA